MGEIAGCAARMKGAGLLSGATVNLRVNPEAREKRRQTARSPKAGATLGRPFCSSTGLTFNQTRADLLLRNELDKAMRKFKRKEPDFAKAYADARIIIELGCGGATTPTTGRLT